MREFKLGIRVHDVSEASEFYCGLGFEQIAVMPGPQGRPLLAVLKAEPFHLILDALRGLPFPDSSRERAIQIGPRGLGCVIGLEVSDLDETYTYCVSKGCEITSPVTSHPWGEKVFTCVDPFGWEWKFAIKTDNTVDGSGPAL
jgi:uncharacterized glyoxalase superfamily protein PhnB